MSHPICVPSVVRIFVDSQRKVRNCGSRALRAPAKTPLGGDWRRRWVMVGRSRNLPNVQAGDEQHSYFFRFQLRYVPSVLSLDHQFCLVHSILFSVLNDGF